MANTKHKIVDNAEVHKLSCIANKISLSMIFSKREDDSPRTKIHDNEATIRTIEITTNREVKCIKVNFLAFLFSFFDVIVFSVVISDILIDFVLLVV